MHTATDTPEPTEAEIDLWLAELDLPNSHAGLTTAQRLAKIAQGEQAIRRHIDQANATANCYPDQADAMAKIIAEHRRELAELARWRQDIALQDQAKN